MLGGSEPDEPPDRGFSDVEAIEMMEDYVHEVIDQLPDFPGFERRSYLSTACQRASDGGTDDGYHNIEIVYDFSSDDSKSDLIRHTYREEIRQYFDDQGLELHHDEAKGDEPDTRYSMAARNEDGINFWARFWPTAHFIIQSGCIEKSGELPEYIPPAGDVSPEEDQPSLQEGHWFTGTPNADNNTNDTDESTDAINPFN